MISLSYFRKNLDLFASSAIKRGVKIDFSKLNEDLNVYDQLCNSLGEIRKEREALYMQNRDESPLTLRNILGSLDEKIGIYESDARSMLNNIKSVILKLPNMLSEEVADEDIEVLRYGETLAKEELPMEWINNFFNTHLGVKLVGPRFTAFTVDGSRLFRAIQKLFIYNAKENGYKELVLPVITSETSLLASGHLSFFEESMFAIEDKKLFLIPTSEVAILNYHRDDMLDSSELPVRYCCFAEAFRKEAGTYGKRDKNIRLHQFHKLELFSFCLKEDENEEQQKMLYLASELLKNLQLPFRIILNSVANTSFHSQKTYDIEVWIPSIGYVEVSSCSNVSQFQSVRANIKTNIQKKKVYVSTLNGTCFSVERIMLALIEHFSVQKRNSVSKNISDGPFELQLPECLDRFLEE